MRVVVSLSGMPLPCTPNWTAANAICPSFARCPGVVYGLATPVTFGALA
jgi:hypothetical protein